MAAQHAYYEWDLLQVCNHESKCHCDPGWAPPFCDVQQSELPQGTLLSWHTPTDSPLLPALLITMIYTWPICSVFHWAAILGLNFSWALKQSCSVLMNTSRHWCSGISLLVCTYVLIMLQRSLLPEGGDVCCYLLILGQKKSHWPNLLCYCVCVQSQAWLSS